MGMGWHRSTASQPEVRWLRDDPLDAEPSSGVAGPGFALSGQGPGRSAQPADRPASKAAGVPDWVVQSFFAAVLLATGYYSAHHDGVLSADVRTLYRSAFAADYSEPVGVAFRTFLLRHGIDISAVAGLPAAMVFHIPLQGPVVSDFRPGHPEVTIAGAPRSPVLAAGAGTVIRVARSRGGDVVTIDHGSPGQTVYMGLGDVAVAPGGYVSAGQVIGRLPDGGRPRLLYPSDAADE